MYVTSPASTCPGPGGRVWWSSTFKSRSAIGDEWSGFVVMTRNFFFKRASRPNSRMYFATEFSLTWNPNSFSSSYTLGCSSHTFYDSQKNFLDCLQELLLPGQWRGFAATLPVIVSASADPEMFANKTYRDGWGFLFGSLRSLETSHLAGWEYCCAFF